MNTATLNIENEVQISIEKGLYDTVDICRDIMERNENDFDFSTKGSLFYYTPLAVQDVINKSHEE